MCVWFVPSLIWPCPAQQNIDISVNCMIAARQIDIDIFDFID